MPLIYECKIGKYENGKISQKNDHVVVEQSIDIYSQNSEGYNP